MKNKILYYYPSNKRTIAFNSLMKELISKGFEMHLLTTCERGVLHEDAEKIGVKVHAHPINKTNPIFYYLKQITFLIRFCKKNKIDVVLSNLQHVNFISVLAQFFIRSKVVIYRHHFKYNHLTDDTKINEETSSNEAFFDKVINRLAKKIVVPANSVKDGMVQYEHADPKKISIMQYLYDFDTYSKVDTEVTDALKEKYKAKMVLLMCSRLIIFKRHHIVFPVIKKLVKEKGFDIKLIVLDEGPQKETLQKYIIDNKLEQHIFLLGYQTEFINYMAISDLMIHPSLTEASNSAVKEMALLNKVSIVCDGVGDFSDYFVNEENGFLISAKNSEATIEKVLTELYQDKSRLPDMGQKLNKTVRKRFTMSDENVLKYIQSFNAE